MVSNVSESGGFKKGKKLLSGGCPIHLDGELPGEGAEKGVSINVVVVAKDSEHEKAIRLTKKIAEGGEGSVFETSAKGYVAKIYHRNKITSERNSKLEAMIDSPILCEGVCFPEALLLNSKKEPVGYLMQAAKGYELGRSIFQPKLFLKRFPQWTRADSIDLCLTILDKIAYLNSRGIIIGDINPANILVVSPKEVYFVDCDSYQIGGYPCPVGTANFTAPEAQGRDYKTFLRTQEMENFAIATLMFMIMLPGKPPYSAVGGASPEKNIANGVFPYPLTEDTDKTPPGKWGYIWSHLSYKTKEAFFHTFKKGGEHFAPRNRYSAKDWIEIFRKYRKAINKMVSNDPMSMEVFPTRRKGDNVVEHRRCKNCSNAFPVTRNQIDWEQRKTESEGKLVKIEVCESCKSRRTERRYDSDSCGPASDAPNQQSRSNVAPRASRMKASPGGDAMGGSKIQGYAARTSARAQAVNAAAGKDKSSFWLGIIAAILAIAFLFAAACSSELFQDPPSSEDSAPIVSSQTYQSMHDEIASMPPEKFEKAGYLQLGSYPTGADGSFGPIYWIKVKSSETYDEYVSVFVLDWKPCNDEAFEVEWRNTSLHSWLNSEFIEAAFPEEETASLMPFSDDGLVNLLNVGEVDLLQSYGISASSFPTPYAVAQGAEAIWEEPGAAGEEVVTGLENWWLSYEGAADSAPTAYGASADEQLPLTQACGVVPAIRVAK